MYTKKCIIWIEQVYHIKEERKKQNPQSKLEQVSNYMNMERRKNTGFYMLITLSPISETNIKENAAVKPDFAIAAKIVEGPPLTKAIRENSKPHPSRTRATERG